MKDIKIRTGLQGIIQRGKVPGPYGNGMILRSPIAGGP